MLYSMRFFPRRLTKAAQFLILAICLAIPLSSAVASQVTYEFAAPSIYSTHPTFGLPAPTGAVIGRFSYDPATPANYTIEGEVCECLGYRQQISGGFTATFGDVTVSADHYVVELFDDLPQGPGVIADVVTIFYSSNLTPPTPLLVNGVPHDSGKLLVSFLQYSGGQFDSPNLAELQGLENFELAFAFLGDTADEDYWADVSAQLRELNIMAAPSADFDGDFVVDGSDFLIWQRSVGQSGPGDANGDEWVDAADLNIWQQQFPSGAAQAAVVPEPNVARLLGALGLLLSPWLLRKQVE